MQGLSYTNAPTATPSRDTPVIAKVVNMGRPGLSNDIIWAVHEMRKSDQNHRSSVVARVTKDRVWAGERFFVNSRQSAPPKLSTRGGPALHPLRIWRDERGQRSRRVLLLWDAWKPRVNDNFALRNWELERYFAHRKRARTDWGSQTTFLGCSWHLVDKASWF